jgi:site-specific recombinase XerD
VHFFRDQRINTIRPGHLENYKTWRAECQIKAVSIRHDLHAASQLFQFAQKQGWCETNPVRLVEIPSDRESRNDRILSLEEEQKYLAAAAKNDSLYDLARLMLLQGLRPQELLMLQKQHVDLEKRELHVIDSKTPAATRTINLTSESC